MTVKILHGDCREVLKTLPDQSVHCCVTSPPYFGLRDYGVAGQIGLEATPEAFVAKMVEVFREVRRVLRDDGTLWLNLGDSYNGSGATGGSGKQHTNGGSLTRQDARAGYGGTLKQKDLIGIPWMVAFALRADGWYLRQDIIWAKPNPMPESVTDRCTKSHEYLFLLSKSPRYYFDQDAIAEPLAAASIDRLSQPNLENQAGSDRVPGKTNGPMKAVGKNIAGNMSDRGVTRTTEGLNLKTAAEKSNPNGTRNKRDVWTVATQPFKEAHFATFPPALIEPCVLAGCPQGGVVLDPFAGAGTTLMVAARHHRSAIGIELNPSYAKLASERIEADCPLFSEVEVLPSCGTNYTAPQDCSEHLPPMPYQTPEKV